jgi:para-nitrobenzyl esterase
VLVWIHGGGAVMGSPNDSDGTSFAQAGIIVVTIAYRLGALGLLHLPGVFNEPVASNFAILDQIRALEWVQQNIEAFGGDPTRVTVAGQSNGARCIGSLLAAPAANGRFSQALMMSGTGVGYLISDEEQAELVTTALLKELGIERPDAARLRDIPLSDLVAAQTRLVAGWPTLLPFQAVIDGVTIPERPIEAINRGTAKEVKLLVGTTHDEYDSFALNISGPSEYRSMFVDPATVDAATAEYRRLLPDGWTDAEVARNALTSSDWWIPAIRVAEAHARAGGLGWMYRLDWRLAPRGEGLGAPHGLDTAVFAPPDAPPSVFTPNEKDAPRFRSVIRQMRRAIAAFVSDGDLSSWRWLPYEVSSRATYLFDDLSRAEFDPDRDLRLVWQDLL